MPRLADIAKHADVSEATVSRVLNGRPGVAESTRQSVLTALDVLGYDRRPVGCAGPVLAWLDSSCLS